MESEILYPGRLARDPVDSVSTGYGVHPHLDRVFLAVVDNANRHIGLPDAIDRHARLADLDTVADARLHDSDMVDGLPIPIVHLERLPSRRKARSKMQLVHFEREPQK